MSAESLLDLVANLLADPAAIWPGERIALQLVDTFASIGCASHAHSPVGGFAYDIWPTQRFVTHFEDMLRWGHQAPSRHPLLRFYLATGEIRTMQVRDVPSRIADGRLRDAWDERGRSWGGVQSQLSIPIQWGPDGHRAFVLGRVDPYTKQEMALACRLGRVLAALDRHVETLGRWTKHTDTQTRDVAQGLQLTPRELAVLDLLGEGLTAAAIARRLAVSQGTVHKHLERIYTKLAVNDRLSAVLRAQRIGLLPAPSPDPVFEVSHTAGVSPRMYWTSARANGEASD